MSELQNLNRSLVVTPSYPERILQFGEGNFLRAFANWMIHKMNKEAGFDAGVVAVQPIDQGLVKMLNDQDGLYTLYLNGIKNGEVISEHEVIDCIQRGLNPYTDYEEYLAIADNSDLRFVISNTTEAGISYNEGDKLEDAPAKSFPAKLTALLFKRFETFNGDPSKGLIFIPCELIDRNGDNLRRIILQYAHEWNLENDFTTWLENDNIFCNTLVDRIVPGYPKSKIDEITKELGYKDNLVVEGEQFHLWVIEGPESVKDEFPSESIGLNVVFTDNMEPYRTRKVRILNGAHTSMVPVAYLYGIETVRESVEDEVIGQYIKDVIFNEICPTLDLPEAELNSFANDVLDRFKNPYLVHALMSISLNSISKFKTRVLPSILEFQKRKNALPEKLVLSFAALIAFYKGEVNGKTIALNDDKEVLEFFKTAWSEYNGSEDSLKTLATTVLSNADFWGQDLTEIAGFTEDLARNIGVILNGGMKAALSE
ncbi:tagaturonate reductase [Reichenbachiella sp. MALMAid0571]|uniref:tagaturonate reductase n=1 Tax=Reichenbachiella sp. MALMAid0571 TaxID=3143939 RepID=UPI0032DED5DB